MNKILVLLLAVSIIACKRKPFVEHKLKFEKVSEDCREQQTYFRMNSNFGGERYEFEKCLAADFKEDQLHAAREGDTVVISFPKTSQSQKTVVYHITLDIDSYPRYGFLTVDGDMYTVAPSEK
jgi:hypothetical protein